MNRNDQKFIAQKIRSAYVEKEATELDALRLLDTKVKRPARLFSYIFGSFSALVMGAGMSLVMTELPKALGMGDATVPGIVIGVIGMTLAALAYPVYLQVMKKEREKVAPEIIRLSDELMK